MARKPPPKKPKPSIRQRARRDVNVALMPQRQLLDRMRAQSIRDAGQHQDQLRALYGGLQDTLGGLTGPSDKIMSGIAGDLQDQLKGLTGQLGSSSSPAGELAAAGGLFGNIGADALGQLASDRSRNVTYNTSAQRQGGEEGLVARRNTAQDLFSQLADIRQQQEQIGSQFGPQFLSHLGDLRDQLFQQGLAQKEFLLRKQQEADQQSQNDALVQFLQDQIGGGLGIGSGGGGGGGGAGGGFPGPGNGNGGVHGGPGRPGPQGHPNPGSGGDNPGATPHPFLDFVSGQEGWGKLNPANRKMVGNKINDYWVHHGTDPAFASLQHYAAQHPNHPSLPPALHTPSHLEWLIRQFYYGPHSAGSPGGKPLP